MTGDEDKKTTDDWKADADGILIFVSRHSTSGTYGRQSSPQRLVHPLPSSRHWSQCPCRMISSRTLRTSAFYLASIYKLLANSNGSYITAPPILPDPTTPSPLPNAAGWVNSLWFVSLTIALPCALLATILPTMGPPVHEGYPATTQPASTSGEGSGRTLLRTSTIFIFLGQLKCCPYCCTFLRSFSLRASPCSFSISLT